MLSLIPILLPLIFGLLSLFLKETQANTHRRSLIICFAASSQLILNLVFLILLKTKPQYTYLLQNRYLAVNPLSILVLGLLNIILVLASIYIIGYLRYRLQRPSKIFCLGILSFFTVTNLICFAEHLGVLWVAIEASTLTTAPLIYFNKTPRSIEATWKYLLMCSVGIALSLLGTFFLAYAAIQNGEEPTLIFSELLTKAPLLHRFWLHGAFILLLVGYGTKLGLAPLHSWKPDAYGESPGVIGALLAAALTSTIFLSIVRIQHICLRSGQLNASSKILIILGILSIYTASVFLLKQRDLKRLLAYSSIENMGVLCLALGLGKSAILASFIHLVHNSLLKSSLFLSVGNIQRAFKSKLSQDISNLRKILPFSSKIFIVGFLAMLGMPPFGLFTSKLLLLQALFKNELWWVTVSYLLGIFLIFIGMSSTLSQSLKEDHTLTLPLEVTSYRESALTYVPPALLLALSFGLGLYTPPYLADLFTAALNFMGTP